MQCDSVHVTNTNTLHVEILCTKCTDLPPKCLDGEDVGQAPNM